MHNLQNVKFVNLVNPAAIVDDAAYTSNVIDCAGYESLCVIAHVGATDIAMVALKVQESDAKTDATTLTSGADVSGLVYGTSVDPDTAATSTLPSATDDNKLFAFFIDLKGRKRYLQLAATAGNGSAGTFMSAIGILDRAQESPYNATTRGLGANLIA